MSICVLKDVWIFKFLQGIRKNIPVVENIIDSLKSDHWAQQAELCTVSPGSMGQ